jgi:hypothetical protein
MVCRHVTPITQATDPDVAPVIRPLGVVQLVRAFGRSPPDSRRSSIDPPLHLCPPIKMGRSDVRLVSSMTDGWGVASEHGWHPARRQRCAKNRGIAASRGVTMSTDEFLVRTTSQGMIYTHEKYA